MYLFKTDLKVALPYLYLSSLVCLMGERLVPGVWGHHCSMVRKTSSRASVVLYKHPLFERTPLAIYPQRFTNRICTRGTCRLFQKYDFIRYLTPLHQLSLHCSAEFQKKHLAWIRDQPWIFTGGFYNLTFLSPFIQDPERPTSAVGAFAPVSFVFAFCACASNLLMIHPCGRCFLGVQILFRGVQEVTNELQLHFGCLDDALISDTYNIFSPKLFITGKIKLKDQKQTRHIFNVIILKYVGFFFLFVFLNFLNRCLQPR